MQGTMKVKKKTNKYRLKRNKQTRTEEPPPQMHLAEYPSPNLRTTKQGQRTCPKLTLTKQGQDPFPNSPHRKQGRYPSFTHPAQNKDRRSLPKLTM